MNQGIVCHCQNTLRLILSTARDWCSTARRERERRRRQWYLGPGLPLQGRVHFIHRLAQGAPEARLFRQGSGSQLTIRITWATPPAAHLVGRAWARASWFSNGPQPFLEVLLQHVRTSLTRGGVHAKGYHLLRTLEPSCIPSRCCSSFLRSSGALPDERRGGKTDGRQGRVREKREG